MCATAVAKAFGMTSSVVTGAFKPILPVPSADLFPFFRSVRFTFHFTGYIILQPVN